MDRSYILRLTSYEFAIQLSTGSISTTCKKDTSLSREPSYVRPPRWRRTAPVPEPAPDQDQ